MRKGLAPSAKAAIELFKKAGGVLKTSEAKHLGIHFRTLSLLKERGEIEPLERGLYRLVGAQDLQEPDLLIVARKIPQGVIGLISALHLHGLTLEIPRQVDVFLKKAAKRPRPTQPPIQFYWISPDFFDLGVMEKVIDRTTIRVTSPERTVVDCFRFRNRIGLSVAVEALKNWNKLRTKNRRLLVQYATTCRVEKVMRPYLEALA